MSALVADSRGAYGHSTRTERFGPDEHQGRPGWQRRSERFLESFDSHSDGQLTLAEVDQVRRDRLAQFDTDKDGKLTVQEYQEYQALWLGLVLEVIVQRSREMITMAVFARQQAERDLEQGRRATAIRAMKMLCRAGRHVRGQHIAHIKQVSVSAQGTRKNT